jgi:hypothetical protein
MLSFGVAALGCSSDDNSSSSTGTQSQTSTGTGSKTDTGTGSKTSTGSVSKTDTGTGASTDTGTGASTDTGTGASTDTGTGASTDTGTDSGTGAVTGSKTVTSTDTSLYSTCTDPTTKAGIVCDATFVACTVPCGPDKVGTKLYTCNTRGTVSGKCSFDAMTDFSCYKIPADVGLCDGAMVIDSTECTRDKCSTCGGPGGYASASDPTPKDGYCVCRDADPVTGLRKWTCKGASEWPCPLGTGCM